MIDYCSHNMKVDNPEYLSKLKRGAWLGDTEEYIYLYEKIGNKLILPFGSLRWLWNNFKNELILKSDFPKKRCVDYKSKIKLYDYQQKAVAVAMKHGNGVIVMPCGSGKTQTALELIARIGGRALWLTHTQDLLNQSLRRAKDVFGIDTFGTITEGKVNIGESITFATVQTMSKIDLQSYCNTWDIVIVDECHRCIGSPTKVMQFYKVLSNINCRYKFGLTATPKRSDGLEKSMFALLGVVIYEVKKTDTCPVSYEQIETNFKPNLDYVLEADGTINYAKLTQNLVEDDGRFNFVLQRIQNAKPAGAMLVLANRVKYLQRLNQYFDGRSICLSGTGQSKKAKEERKRALLALNDGDLDCIFATFQLAKEGLDIPNLRTVVFATPEKNEITVTQSAGRVARTYEGKEFGHIIDFVDNFSFYRRWANRRKNMFKKLNYYDNEN